MRFLEYGRCLHLRSPARDLPIRIEQLSMLEFVDAIDLRLKQIECGLNQPGVRRT